jgi:hypothetical protein
MQRNAKKCQANVLIPKIKTIIRWFRRLKYETRQTNMVLFIDYNLLGLLGWSEI